MGSDLVWLCAVPGCLLLVLVCGEGDGDVTDEDASCTHGGNNRTVSKPHHHVYLIKRLVA